MPKRASAAVFAGTEAWNVLEALPYVIYVVDTDLRLIYGNSRWDQMAASFGEALHFRHFIGSSLLDHVAEPERTRLRDELVRLMADPASGPLRKEVILDGPDGRHVIRQVISPVRDDQGTVAGIVFAGDDISREHQLATQIARLAMTDELTGLPNRRAFTDAFEAESARVRRFGGAASVALVDIDHFKQVNDRHGHLAGDEVLRRVALSMRNGLRLHDFIARWGGEEFSILMPMTSVAEAAGVMDRLRQDVEAMSIDADGETGIRVTISAGVCAIAETLDATLHTADDLLYAAKDAGRNTVRAQE